MKPHNLRQLIYEGESQTLDFKRRISKAYKIAKTLTAFANTKGGQLLIGVEDDGKITGVDPHQESFQLQKAADYFCKPPVNIDYTQVEDEEGRIVLVAEISESEQKPHYAQSKTGSWDVYVRFKDKSIQAGKTAINSMKNGDGGYQGKLSRIEQTVLALFDDIERVTARLLGKALNISERRARRMLVDMTQKGVLHSHDFEKEIFYTLA